MENKDLIIIALVIALIYLYYQQKKQKTLSNFTGTSANLAEINEVKKVNQILADFCKNEIGGQDIQEIRTKLNGRTLTEILAENEDYETTVDGLTRTKAELEAEITLLTNSQKNQIQAKETIITRLKEEKKDLETKLLEAQTKYKKKTKQLDEEQLENNKLEKKITSLETEIEQLKKDQEWPPLSSTKPKK